MANVSHASLTGSNLHEPKGADTAVLGTVYVANGSGGGTWTSVGTSSFTGMIADFPAPVAPSGWLELDGSVISTSTFAALYAVMSITTSGTRTNGSAIITSIPSTANFRAGYFVFGTGITSGSTILTVDSGTQITISIAATSSGSSTLAISPWLLNTGTIQLPDVATAGRYRRSRASGGAIGVLQASQNLAHTHTVSGTSGGVSVNHTHVVSAATATMNSNVTHTHTSNAQANFANQGTASGGNYTSSSSGGATINATNIDHTHNFTATSQIENTDHTHAFGATSSSDGGAEVRVSTLVCLTCVKT